LDKTIITAFLIIGGVVAAVLIYGAVYPAVVQSGDAMTSRQRVINDRLRTGIEIIHATGDGSNGLIWVKNTGSTTLAPIDKCDVFFGPEGDFTRIPYGEGAGNPYWVGELEDAERWSPAATLRITVVYGQSILEGRYFVKISTPNGVSDEYWFSE
jgi:archaellum component FlaF (FlaF/FlaG flagellin family)